MIQLGSTIHRVNLAIDDHAVHESVDEFTVSTVSLDGNIMLSAPQIIGARFHESHIGYVSVDHGQRSAHCYCLVGDVDKTKKEIKAELIRLVKDEIMRAKDALTVLEESFK